MSWGIIAEKAQPTLSASGEELKNISATSLGTFQSQVEQDLTLPLQITHNRLSDYYVAIFSRIKSKDYNIIIYSYVVSRVGQKNHNQNQNQNN